jgi:hypothetical protein
MIFQRFARRISGSLFRKPQFAGGEFLSRRYQSVGILDQPLKVFPAGASSQWPEFLERPSSFAAGWQRPRIGLASFLVLDKQGERFRELTVLFAPGII